MPVTRSARAAAVAALLALAACGEDKFRDSKENIRAAVRTACADGWAFEERRDLVVECHDLEGGDGTDARRRAVARKLAVAAAGRWKGAVPERIEVRFLRSTPDSVLTVPPDGAPYAWPWGELRDASLAAPPPDVTPADVPPPEPAAVPSAERTLEPDGEQVSETASS